MNIYAKEGDKVIYLGKNGTNYDKEYANARLKVDEIYTISYTEVGNWKTDVYLSEVEGTFNSVMFKDLFGDEE